MCSAMSGGDDGPSLRSVENRTPLTPSTSTRNSLSSCTRGETSATDAVKQEDDSFGLLPNRPAPDT